MIQLSEDELIKSRKLIALKKKSGTHSPSFHAIRKLGINVNIDGCFLSNPYATDLFIDYMNKDLIETNKLRKYIELYPSQNTRIAHSLSKRLNISSEYLFIGNGAIEIIQAILHRYVKGKIAIPIPTFSSYYEFLTDETTAYFYQLSKEDNYKIDIDNYINYINKNKINNALIINPNNPDGGYLPQDKLVYTLESLKHLDTVILDESFIHFAKNGDNSLVRNEELIKKFPNLFIIKSLSKDFGIAGIRCGYAVVNPDVTNKLLSNGFLWNSSGLSEYFFNLYSDNNFYSDYLLVREKYINETEDMFHSLSKLKGIKVLPSNANFYLIELTDGTLSSTLYAKLMIKYGIYVRNCSDKIGLKGQYIRLASRSREENTQILKAFTELYS